MRPFAESADERRRFGRYYTPPPLVGALHRLLSQALAEAGLPRGETTLVDPACGPGAFLGAAEAQPYKSRTGLDLDASALALAREAHPAVTWLEGSAYEGGLETLVARVAGRGPVAVIGNPPYTANSELLRSDRYRAVRDRLLPFARDVASGTSVRDDYVLFFGVADRLVEAAGAGAIAFVTSASFVDNFLYAPLRRWLLSRYRLHALVELGPKLFEGTRVATALSVWVRSESAGTCQAFGHARLAGSPEQRLLALASPLDLAPARPHGKGLSLNAPSADSLALVEAMRNAGDPIGSVVRVSLPGLKTRFEELLVHRDRDSLADRMQDFFAARDVDEFASRHHIPGRSRPKLVEAFAARAQTAFDPRAIRPFAQYAGPRHRFRVPGDAMAFAYVDRALIPRGDHRFRGPWDPHREGPKLVFNVREVPLCAAVVEGPTCVHDWQHARFAPLRVPELVAREGPGAARRANLESLSLNLSTPWLEAAGRLGEPAAVFDYVCAIVNSRLVQERFAPVAGESEEVPVARVTARKASAARELARASRQAAPGASLPPFAERLVEAMYQGEGGNPG